MGSLLASAMLALAWLSPGTAKARSEGDKGTVSFVLENDLFYDTDRNYTNGVRLEWLSEPASAPDWAVNGARQFPLFPDGGRVRVSYAIGQNMYTPADIALAAPPPDDRPYAGWLYASVGVIAENGRVLDQFQLTLGMVGPASLAEQTQKLVHSIVGAPEPQGWDSQLKNEPGLILSYQRSWRDFYSESVSGFGFDVTPHVGGAVGNVFTYANAGLTLRVGTRLPRDYGPPRIQPSLPGSGFFARQAGFGWYLFAGGEGRAVARNVFLDGNSFRKGSDVRKEPFVADFQYGFALTWEWLRLSYTHVVRSPEFKGQMERDNFGAVSLSVRL